MTNDTITACLAHLESADALLRPDRDGIHRARLAHVIDGLRDAYGLPVVVPEELSRHVADAD